jgi:uncharacterized RDD family membrane protein YckC
MEDIQIKQVKDALSKEQIRPWIRFWARFIDTIIFELLLFLPFILILMLDIGINLDFLDEIPNIITGILLGFIYIFIEPIFFSIWGTTMGKALFKIQVRHTDGKKLSYTDSLKRTFLVWFLGQGMGFPIVGLITNIVAFNKLKDKGITSWDESEGYVVTHQTIGKVKATILISIIILIFIFIAISILH